MTEQERDSYYTEIAQTVAKASTCYFCNIGCVIVDKDDHVVAVDALKDRDNVLDCRKDGCCAYYSRTGEFINSTGNPDSCDYTFPVVNAILSAQRERLQGATIYMYCYDLQTKKTKEVKVTKTLANIVRAAGISRIVMSKAEEEISL